MEEKFNAGKSAYEAMPGPEVKIRIPVGTNLIRIDQNEDPLKSVNTVWIEGCPQVVKAKATEISKRYAFLFDDWAFSVAADAVEIVNDR